MVKYIFIVLVAILNIALLSDNDSSAITGIKNCLSDLDHSLRNMMGQKNVQIDSMKHVLRVIGELKYLINLIK